MSSTFLRISCICIVRKAYDTRKLNRLVFEKEVKLVVEAMLSHLDSLGEALVLARLTKLDEV